MEMSNTNLGLLILISILKIISLCLFISFNYCKHVFDIRFGSNRNVENDKQMKKTSVYIEMIFLIIHPMWFLRGYKS